MKKSILLLACIYLILPELDAQLTYRTLQATRIGADISIDGILDDEAWKLAEIATDFIQTDPVFREKPSQKTEVRVIYDDRGIYIGAMMYDDEPNKILKELSQRDQRGNADWFGVSFDTYRDGLNGFDFSVTASGVQSDQKFSGDEDDNNWDGIWESEVMFLENGWSVEIFIPYLSLRFPNKEIQAWNVNFAREIRRNREQVYWNPVNPAIEGFINQAGHLEGIKNIKSPIRLSVTPFVTGYINTVNNPGTNLGTDASTAYTAGMDLKYGINDAFTLDMTLIPDFGQVISDNQVLNLSPFEVFFEENRQFFTEGIELFNKGGLFYTRRVGGRPINFFNAYGLLESDEVITDNPDVAQLYNATKVSGRLSSGTGIGFFNAVAGEEYATVKNLITGEERQILTSPLTNYNVLVADQNLANNSVVSLINTNVSRQGDDYDANVTGAFLSLRDKNQNYGFEGKFISSNKFYQNETQSGHAYSLSAGKIGGNWKGSLDYDVESDDYDTNDLGFLFSPNERSLSGNLSYNDYKPKIQSIQRWEVGITPNYSRLYKPNVFADFAINMNSFLLWKSRNAVGVNMRLEPVETFDYFEPRTADFSKFYTFPTNWMIGSFFSSDYRKTFALDIRGTYRSFNEEERDFFQLTLSPRIRVNDKLSFFLNSTYTQSDREVGYVSTGSVNEPIEGIEAGDVMLGTRDRQILENSIRCQFIFNNKMFLTARIRHYWDQVEYQSFGKLLADGYLESLVFDGKIDGVPVYDTNVNFFNIDLNYTWRFAKGSDLIFVWKQSISSANKDFELNYFDNFSKLFDARQFNSLSLKIVYFLDYDSVVN